MEHREQLIQELRAELALREQELDLLHQIDLRMFDPDQTPKDVFKFIVHRTLELLQANHISILLRRSTYLESVYSSMPSTLGQRIPLAKCIGGLCLESDAQYNIADLLCSPHRSRYAPLQANENAGMRSILATPVRIRGTAVGVLNSESTRANAFTLVHERVSAVIAAQIAIALQRTQTLDSDLLFADLDRMIFSSEDTQGVIQAALEKVMSELQRLEHVQHSGAQIMFLRGENQLEIMHSTNTADVGMILPVNKSVSGRAIREQRTIIVEDVSREPDYHRMLGDSIRSEISVPILFGEDDMPIGILNVESAELHAFHKFYQIILESFAEKVKTLLAFAKLRTDVTEALEMRTADEFLVAVGDQTSHMIHRINTTVGAMRLRVIELQNLRAAAQLDGNDFLDQSLEALRSLAERALKMPDEVLHILSQDRSGAHVNECVRHAISQIEVPDTVHLEVNLGDDIPALPLYCFDIVVQNLVQNGIDAMPDGGKLCVRTDAVIHPTLSTGYLQLVVSDTGKGIADGIRSRVFDLNFTTKKVRGSGLGFGLWWVRNFVLRSRGDIVIDSVPGLGTNVTVKIPIGMPGDSEATDTESIQADGMLQ